MSAEASVSAVAENSGSVNLAWSSLAWEAKRGAVLAEAGFVCEMCGAVATEVDHVWPVTEGGTDDRENLQAACRSCNARKGSRTVGMRTTLDELERGTRYARRLYQSLSDETSMLESVLRDMRDHDHGTVREAVECLGWAGTSPSGGSA